MLQRLRFVQLTVLCWILVATGCTSSWFSSNPGKNAVGTRREMIKEKLESEKRPTIINEIGTPAMLTQSRLENIGLVTQLSDTGGTVKASQQREKLLDMMRRNDAEMPNAILDNDATAMVVSSVVVPPGAARGQKLDVLVKLSSHAEATDLQHGWLLETPLMEMNRLGGQVRQGFERCVADGQVVTRSQISGDATPQAKLEGLIVGGGKLLKGRPLGISIEGEFADAITMHAIVPAINNRFTYFNGRQQTGIATPRDDRFIEIAVPPRYRLDPFHFVNVILQISFNELEADRVQRMETLRRQLYEPTTVRVASWQLEAIGEESIPILVEAMNSSNPEVRFYAAHALAYLGDKRAIRPLTSLCRQEPAFRAMCLNGLVVIDDYEASDALRELLHAADPEVKYGAVLALRDRDASDPEVMGQPLGEVGHVLEIPSSGPPLVAVSLSETAEVAIFGGTPHLQIPAFHYVNPSILISPTPGGGLTVSHFAPGEEDQIIQAENDLRSVLAAITEVGGGYGDWVKFVRECHENGFISEPVALSPIPRSGRTYQRKQTTQLEPGESLIPQTIINTPEIESSDEDTSEDESSVWYNPLSWAR